MTPSPPDEALHFRGKTLTPESPRPLHIPEPANIPVLENQMDPVFNDTASYDYGQETTAPQRQDGWSGYSQDGQHRPDHTQPPGSLSGSREQAMHNDMTISAAADSFPSSAPAMASSGGTSDSHAPPAVPVPQGFAPPNEIDTSAGPQQHRLDVKQEDPGLGGVDFQNLLDNLSAASSTGPTAAPPMADSSLHQAPPTDEPPPSHLPVRPHPIASGDESHAYHHFPAHNSAAVSQPTQPSNQPPLPNIGAPGTVPGSGALPPPPPATFQQSLPTGADSTVSSQEPPSKKGRGDKQAGRPGNKIWSLDDDAPWGPEVQKKYDEFLHDERVYVTEGLWDRFPIGSRLFVGQYTTSRLLLSVH